MTHDPSFPGEPQPGDGSEPIPEILPDDLDAVVGVPPGEEAFGITDEGDGAPKEEHHHLRDLLEPDPERDLELLELENDASFNNMAAVAGPLAFVIVPVSKLASKGVSAVKGLLHRGSPKG